MKKITDLELRELSFSSIIRVVWTNSSHHNCGEHYDGVIFGDKIGYKDGCIDKTFAIAECIMIGAMFIC